MDLTHRLSVPAGRDETWNAFADPARLARCFPGATVTGVDGDTFTGSVKVKVGPTALVYSGSGTYVERDPDRARIVVKTRGEDTRGNGTATTVVTAKFVARGEGTDVELRTTLTIDGKPGQLGYAVISDVGDKLFEQFASCVTARLAEGPDEPEPVQPTGPPAVDRPTVELGASPGDIRDPDPLSATSAGGSELGGVDAPPDVDTTPAAPAPPPTVPRPAPRAVGYTPPANSARPDFDVVASVTPALLKRFWPVLGGSAAALFVVSRVVKRVRR